MQGRGGKQAWVWFPDPPPTGGVTRFNSLHPQTLGWSTQGLGLWEDDRPHTRRPGSGGPGCGPVTVTELPALVQGTHAGTEVGADFAQADGGVAADGALLILSLQPREVLHQLHVEVGLVQLRGQEQHGLQGGRRRKVWAGAGILWRPPVALGTEETKPAKALPNRPPTWSWPLPRMLRKVTPTALHSCLPSLSVSSLLRALYSDFHKNTSTYTLYQLAWVEVTNDLHVAKSKGQFSILTKLDPSAALTAPNSPSSSQLWSLVLPGHRPLLVL